MLSEYLPQFLLAWSIQWAGVLSPGPGVALILGVATSQGRGPALLTTLGIACAAAILATLTAVGLASILAQSSGALLAMRIGGGLYLLWLAVKSFKAAAAAQSELPTAPQTRGTVMSAIGSGFLMQLSNPKAIFFWLAVAGVGGVGDAPPHLIALFVAVAAVNSYVGHGAYALLLSSGAIRRVYFRFRKWVEGALGAFYVLVGAKVISSSQ